MATAPSLAPGAMGGPQWVPPPFANSDLQTLAPDNAQESLIPAPPHSVHALAQLQTSLASPPVFHSTEGPEAHPRLAPRDLQSADISQSSPITEGFMMPTISENAKTRRRTSARTNQSSAAPSPAPGSPAPQSTEAVPSPNVAPQPPKRAAKRAAPSSTPASKSKSSKRAKSGPGPLENGAVGATENSSIPVLTDSGSRRPRAKMATEYVVQSELTKPPNEAVDSELPGRMAPPDERAKRRSARSSITTPSTLAPNTLNRPMERPPSTEAFVEYQPPSVLHNRVSETPKAVQPHMKVNGAGAARLSMQMLPTPEQSFLAQSWTPDLSVGPSTWQTPSLLVNQDDEILLSLKLEKAQTRQHELDLKIQMRQVELRNNQWPYEAPTASTSRPIPSNPVHSQTQLTPEIQQTLPAAPSGAALSDTTKAEAGQKDPLERRPYQNAAEDEQYVARVKQSLKRFSGSKVAIKDRNFTHKATRRLLPLLEKAKPPDKTEARWLTGNEAAELVKPTAFFPGPILTEGQQTLSLQSPDQFLAEYYDDSLIVWIQDQAVKQSEGNHARTDTIAAVRARLSASADKGSRNRRAPWNCLELATHRDEGLRPAFLNNEDCSLLTKIKQPGKNDEASRRGFDPGWREVEKWALLAQAGALTEPHQDSHGYSTFITVNHGRVGFGWLSNPNPEERAAWRAEPSSYEGGQWRYVVLRPGQTVYFPAGTIHFVFRLPEDGNTLAFGGHVIRCSQIVPWARAILEEQAQPNVTNEDLKIAAVTYLERVGKYITQAMKNKLDLERWGGEQACMEFMKLKEEIVNFRPSYENDDDSNEELNGTA